MLFQEKVSENIIDLRISGCMVQPYGTKSDTAK